MRAPTPSSAKEPRRKSELARCEKMFRLPGKSRPNRRHQRTPQRTPMQHFSVPTGSRARVEHAPAGGRRPRTTPRPPPPAHTTIPYSEATRTRDTLTHANVPSDGGPEHATAAQAATRPARERCRRPLPGVASRVGGALNMMCSTRVRLLLLGGGLLGRRLLGRLLRGRLLRG